MGGYNSHSVILQLDVSQTNRQTIVEMISLFLFQDFQEVIVFWKRGEKRDNFWPRVHSYDWDESENLPEDTHRTHTNARMHDVPLTLRTNNEALKL